MLYAIRVVLQVYPKSLLATYEICWQVLEQPVVHASGAVPGLRKDIGLVTDCWLGEMDKL